LHCLLHYVLHYFRSLIYKVIIVIVAAEQRLSRKH